VLLKQRQDACVATQIWPWLAGPAGAWMKDHRRGHLRLSGMQHGRLGPVDA
jgi:hypothetical protein